MRVGNRKGSFPKKTKKSATRNAAGLTHLDQDLLREGLRFLQADDEFQQARHQARQYKLWVYDLVDMKAGENRRYRLQTPSPSLLLNEGSEIIVSAGQSQAYQTIMESGIIDRLSQQYDLEYSSVHAAIFHRGEYPLGVLFPRRSIQGYLAPEVYHWPEREPAGVGIAYNPVEAWRTARALLVQQGVSTQILDRVEQEAAGLLLEASVHVYGHPTTGADPFAIPQLWVRIDVPPGAPPSEVARVYRIQNQRRRDYAVLLGQRTRHRRRASQVTLAAPDVLLKTGRLQSRTLINELSQSTSSEDEDHFPTEEEDRRAANTMAVQRTRIKHRRSERV